VRRFDPDTFQNGHIYSSIKEEELFMYGLISTSSEARILWAGLINICN